MDVHKTKPLRSAALQKATDECLRMPLVPSERIQKNNAAPVACKPRTREVASRYKSGIAPVTPVTPTSQRCPSPNVTRMGLSPPPSLPKRSQSAERKRPTTTPIHQTSAMLSPSRTSTPSSQSLRPSTPAHDVSANVQLSSRQLGGGRMPDGLWPSMRSLSASFQSDSISLPLGKREKPVSNSNITPNQLLKSSGKVKMDRERTPSRVKSASDQSENLKPAENSHTRVLDQHRWPRVMNGKFSARDMSRSVDLTDRVDTSRTLPASFRGVSPTRKTHISDGPNRGLQNTHGQVTRGTSLDGSGGLECEFGSNTGVPVNPSERATSLTHPNRTVPLPQAGSSYLASPIKTSLPSASCRQMASPSRMRPSTPSLPSKNSLSSAASRSMVSPSCRRPSTPSPSKNSLQSTSSRGMVSPARTRPSTPLSSSAAGQTGIASSVLSYIVDVQKGKKNANHIETAHQLRLLCNRDLQWRFVNARADAAMSIQKMTTENTLYNVRVTTSEMRDSVIMKRINIQQMRQEMKRDLILKEQMSYLEDSAVLEREHTSSLLGALAALKASTIRLPVTGRTKADVHALQGAIVSAVDVMQATSSSIYHLLSRVEGAATVVSELAEVAARERAMLSECRELLASIAAMQVQESSLRTHLLQLGKYVIESGESILTTRIQAGDGTKCSCS